MSDVEMRLGQPTDAAAIRRLTHEAYAKWVPVLGHEPLPMTADYEAAVRAHRFDLLFVDGALAALIETAQEPDHLPDHLLIVNVAVAPTHQGRGHGRRLLAHAESIAASHGHGLVRLYTNKRLTANIALYGRLGYTVDREAPFATGIAVHMSKQLG